MTIQKGESWGERAPLPDDGVLVRSDAEAREVLTQARNDKRPFPTLGLLGGDLCRTLGGPSDRSMTFTMDLGEVLLDGRMFLFVAHLVARRQFWRGRAVVAMNAAWLGPYNLGPKAHPNDGLLDLSEGSLPLAERIEARRRARVGAHVPHPRIDTRRVPAAQFHFDSPIPVRLDGELVGRFRDISVRVEPDAFRAVV
jgi:putative lipid kinase YegS-like protein